MNKSTGTLIAIFGRRLKALRKKKKMSQEQLALKADLDPSYVGQLERGNVNVSLAKIDKLAKALDISYAVLFDFEDLLDTEKDNELIEQFFYLLRNKSARSALVTALNVVANQQKK